MHSIRLVAVGVCAGCSVRLWSARQAASLLSSLLWLDRCVLRCAVGPGSGEFLPGTTVVAEPQLAGIDVVNEDVPFSFSAYGDIVSGYVNIRVLQAVDNTYDFYWRVFNDSTSAGAIGSFRFGDFVASAYDANYRIDSAGDVAPSSAFRFSGAFDSYVNFGFGDLLAPGKSSLSFFMDTDATSYSKTAIYDLANIGTTQNSAVFSMYAPATTVPSVPGPIPLLGAWAAWCSSRRLRRQMRQSR